MERRTFLGLMAAGLAAPGSVRAQASQQPPRNPAIDDLYDRSVVIDSLAVGYEWDDVEYAAVKESGYTGIQTTLSSNNFQVAARALAEWRQRIRENPDKLVQATRAAHIEQAKAEGKMAVVFGFQNATMLEGVLDNLDPLYELGTRCIQLTYNSQNRLGSGCTERVDGGLSDFGVEVVGRMNELGIIVDLSHCGRQTSMDGIEVSGRPAAFTPHLLRGDLQRPPARQDRRADPRDVQQGRDHRHREPRLLRRARSGQLARGLREPHHARGGRGRHRARGGLDRPRDPRPQVVGHPRELVRTPPEELQTELPAFAGLPSSRASTSPSGSAT